MLTLLRRKNSTAALSGQVPPATARLPPHNRQHVGWGCGQPAPGLGAGGSAGRQVQRKAASGERQHLRDCLPLAVLKLDDGILDRICKVQTDVDGSTHCRGTA